MTETADVRSRAKGPQKMGILIMLSVYSTASHDYDTSPTPREWGMCLTIGRREDRGGWLPFLSVPEVFELDVYCDNTRQKISSIGAVLIGEFNKESPAVRVTRSTERATRQSADGPCGEKPPRSIDPDAYYKDTSVRRH